MVCSLSCWRVGTVGERLLGEILSIRADQSVCPVVSAGRTQGCGLSMLWPYSVEAPQEMSLVEGWEKSWPGLTSAAARASLL